MPELEDVATEVAAILLPELPFAEKAAAADLTAHLADTTAVHGIVDTTKVLVYNSAGVLTIPTATTPLAGSPSAGTVAMWVEDDQLIVRDSGGGEIAIPTALGLTSASSLTSGQLGIERLTPGSVIVVDYYKTVYGAASAWPVTRPTARTDICVIWVGPTDPGVIALAGDIIELADA